MVIKKLLSKYNYRLPKNLIAQKPASPRDSARLLVYRRKDGKIFHDNFFSLPKYLPKNAVLVFNQTRVIPARMIVKKPTEGKVELLYIGQNGAPRLKPWYPPYPPSLKLRRGYPPKLTCGIRRSRIEKSSLLAIRVPPSSTGKPVVFGGGG